MVSILHLADLHMGWKPGFLPRDRAAERMQQRDGLLKKAVDFATAPENQIGLVVLAGDLFETHKPEDRLVGHVLAELRRLEAGGVQVVTVPGNHDEITYPDSVYRRYGSDWPGLLVRNPVPEKVAVLSVKGTQVHVYGLAYTGGRTPVSAPLRSFPRVEGPGLHLAVFHGTLGNWGGERSLPLDADALGAAGYDYVALGHIHQPQQIRLGNTLAVYPGATEGKGFDDPGTGRFAVVQLEPGQATVREASVLVTPVQCETLDISRYASVGELEAQLQAICSPSGMTRVTMRGASGFDWSSEALAASLKTRCFWVELVDETERFGPDELAQWRQQPTILGEFIRHMQEQIAATTDERRQRVLDEALRRGVAAMLGGEKR